MKKSKVVKLVTNLALAAVVGAFAGCASGNYKQGEDTSAGLTQSADKIADGNVKIDATLNAMNDLVNSSQGDLVPKFKVFNTAVSDLESTAKEVGSKVAKMREKGNAYFKAWDEQLALIKNEDIKQRSAARKTEVSNKFMDIKRSYTEAKMAFEPFMGEVKDVQTALSTDLTTGGIAAIKGTADKMTKDAVPLKAAVAKLSEQFKELGVAMSSSGPTAQPK